MPYDIRRMLGRYTINLVVADQIRELDSRRTTVRRSLFYRSVSHSGSSALIVKGIRRTGKSTLMKQIMVEKYPDAFYYVNFDDDRLAGFSTEDFQSLMEVFLDLFGRRRAIFLDEIQNVKGWELFVNRLLREGYTVYITGSSANLLSKELGTHLTGRHTDLELYPFSFFEFLTAKGLRPNRLDYQSTEGRVNIEKMFREYMHRGGMPEAVIYNNESVLRQIVLDIIQRDILGRYSILKLNELKMISRFLISNAGKEITYRSISRNFGISEHTVQKYIEYLGETYVIFEVKRYDRKIKVLEKNPRKIYCVDNGIITSNIPSLPNGEGALLENLVAVHLKRIGKEAYYFRDRNGSEADFYIPGTGEILQVCYDLNDRSAKRELIGLERAARYLRPKNAVILTYNQEREIHIEDLNVSVKPAWKWFLETELSGG
ncbi:MAG: ATP-binding protein [Candidatus Thermoplasmatota archaeon]|jgi:predicted AAA+ superfamily ATPase|nr:ATP-binding protein [Candidatus Thermoplasmatota archaeon]